MVKRFFLIRPALLLAAASLLSCAAHGQRRLSVEDRETIRRTLEFSSGAGSKLLEVDNVNGGIEIRKASGSGRARTVNGPVNVTFARNPMSASHFGSINGDIDVTLQPGLSADIRFKTFNGGVYTDLPVTTLPATVDAQRRNGKISYRTEYSSVRAGDGGAVLEFDAFNGDVRIRQAK
jgi:DUF4097 and DUF4098 domain-containing protein YvlB